MIVSCNKVNWCRKVGIQCQFTNSNGNIFGWIIIIIWQWICAKVALSGWMTFIKNIYCYGGTTTNIPNQTVEQQWREMVTEVILPYCNDFNCCKSIHNLTHHLTVFLSCSHHILIHYWALSEIIGECVKINVNGSLSCCHNHRFGSDARINSDIRYLTLTAKG